MELNTINTAASSVWQNYLIYLLKNFGCIFPLMSSDMVKTDEEKKKRSQINFLNTCVLFRQCASYR